MLAGKAQLEIILPRCLFLVFHVSLLVRQNLFLRFWHTSTILSYYLQALLQSFQHFP